LRRHREARLARALIVCSLYALLYFPYPAHSAPIRLLTSILHVVAHASAATIGLFDPSVRVLEGPVINGRFPLQIVLDCAALDVLALFLAAVLSYPAGVRDKLVGAVVGVSFLSLINVGRISALYFVGCHAPASFEVVHGDLLTFVMVAATLGTFGIWVYTLRHKHQTRSS
jgi:exosortase/archaeosortase family protein